MNPLELRTPYPAPGSEYHQGASILLKKDGRVLLVYRAPDRSWAPDSWDVPGGHLEVGETETEAAVREAREELGVTVDLQPDSVVARLKGPNFCVAYFVASSWTGDPYNAAPAEHVAVAWFGGDQLEGLVLADPSAVPIIRHALDAANR